MPAAAALLSLEATTVNKPMFMASAEWTSEGISPARLLQSCLTLLLSAVKLLKLKQGETFLELDAVTRHGANGIYVLAHPALVTFAE